MSKILALFASLWHLIENKTVFVGILTAVGSVGAFYGLNVPIAVIITAATAIMTALGVSGWQSTAVTTQETQLKLAMLSGGMSHRDVHDAYLCAMGQSKAAPAPSPVSAQKGSIQVLALVAIAGITIAAAYALSSGCAASKALGSCEVGVLEKQLPNSAGTIATDLISAVAEGGSGIPALLATIDATYPGSLACLETFVDSLMSSYLHAGAGSGSAVGLESERARLVIADPGEAREGLAALHADMRSRGLPVNQSAVP